MSELQGLLRTALPMQPPEVKKLEEAFSRKLNKAVSLTVKVDATLGAGFVAFVGGRRYDNSLKGRLNRLKFELIKEQEDQQEDVVEAMREQLNDIDLDDSAEAEVGLVTSVGDGIVRLTGLPGVRYGELLVFECGANAMALDLGDEVGAVLLSKEDAVREGMEASRTGRVVEVPASDGLLGRVVNPLGEPLDGMPAIKAEAYLPIETSAPAIMDRKPVFRPLATGITAIDAMIPIGRGQRELIIGDRQTGKTQIAVDTILNQKGQDVICIYVAIGQKASTLAQVRHFLRERGADAYTVIVASTADNPAPMQYIAPYAGCAMGEYFMRKGKDVLVVYDDMTHHAVAYRAMSLLLHRPPGREAYPGDIFYLHSRLLERAAQLSDEQGGGSMTALPIVETMAGDISAYIPTNVISITDGQIFLESELFNSGIRPAINVGLSVSRVGGAAQTKAMRRVSGQLRLSLAQYREMAVFSRFGADLDESTQELLAHGEVLTRILCQKQNAPWTLEEQVVILYAATHKYLKGLKREEVDRFKAEFPAFVRIADGELMERIAQTGELTDEDMERIGDCAQRYLEQTGLGVGGE